VTNPRGLSVETRQKVADLLGEGVSKNEIARRLHLSASKVGEIGEEYGFMKRKAHSSRIPDETVQSAVELLKLGFPYPEVAKELSISVGTVSNIARTHHLSSATGARFTQNTQKNILERLNQGQSPQEIARDLWVTPTSVERFRRRSLLADALSDFVATMGPDMTEAVQANLSRRLGRSSTSPPEGTPAEGTSTGGKTKAPEGTTATEPPPKRPRPESAEPDDIDEIIPPYVDELMDKLGPEKLPLVQTVWDDAVLLLDAESRYAPGSPEPRAEPDPEAAATRLNADVAAVIAALSDEDTDFLLHLSDKDHPKKKA
jgi:DNA-binding CsgD family transcriptional regulator